MIIGISTGQETCLDPWTGFTQFTLLEGKPLDGYLWLGVEINEKTADILARNLENNGKECQAEGEAKVGRMKSSTGENARKL